jgi:hypothetical protein
LLPLQAVFEEGGAKREEGGAKSEERRAKREERGGRGEEREARRVMAWTVKIKKPKYMV